MSAKDDLLYAFETHSSSGIRKAIAAGADPIGLIGEKRAIDVLIEMYTRTPRFAECLRAMLAEGASIDDPLLEAVLLEDAAALRQVLMHASSELHRKLTFVSAYTCCRGVTALHVAAEFNSVRCAQVLIESGADLNARADLDGDGFGGQTPIFHAVNSNGNHCRPVMELLVDAGADLDVRLKGVRWGETMDWETLLLDVTVFSYAQAGSYRQFHREERDIYSNLAYLYKKRYAAELPLRNVPNKYLAT
jgi:ankyrin repeat protein